MIKAYFNITEEFDLDIYPVKGYDDQDVAALLRQNKLSVVDIMTLEPSVRPEIDCWKVLCKDADNTVVALITKKTKTAAQSLYGRIFVDGIVKDGTL
jgi:hypothetical protein